jgi:Ca2+-binding RTX toxin-like protein
MATARFFQQSFSLAFWQDVVDFNAELIELPWTGNGFAFQNIDGTYTAFFGDNVVVGGNANPVSGTVTEILRLSSIDQAPTIGTTQAQITGSVNAFGLYVAYQGGGDAFFANVLSGADTIEIDSPPSLGPLSQSPLIEAYAGDDDITGSINADTIYAGAGSDDVFGGSGADTIYGGPGFDDLFGGGGIDHLFGGEDNDTIHGEGGNDILGGEEGVDFIWGGDGNDIILGGPGALADVLRGGNGIDTLLGGGGPDTIRGGNGVDTLDGGAGDDFLFGEAGDDRIYGDQGDDSIQGGNGSDFIRGGSGFDTVTFNRNRDTYNVQFSQSHDVVYVTDEVGNGGTDTLRGIERLVFADGEVLL